MTTNNEQAEGAEQATALGGADPVIEGQATVVVAAGADTVQAGADTVDAAEGADSVDAGEGADTVEAGAGDEVKPYEGLVAPEGTTLHDDDMALAAPLMRKLGIEDGEAAQGFINDVTPIIAQITERVAQQTAEVLAANRAELTKSWLNDLRADPVLGGANYDRTLAEAARVRDQFFPEDFRAFLNESGLGNHKGLLAGFAKIAAATAEDQVHGGSHQSSPKPGENLYDPAYSPKS